MSYRAALRDFLASPAGEDWGRLTFFAGGGAAAIVARLDERTASGATILPGPADIFAALSLCPLSRTRVVILGQDPYPTAGDAHGLAFSYAGARHLPASLKRIFRELADDLARPAPTNGDLSHWARQGVLLLNAALSVEAGKAGAHLRLGWDSLADEALAAVSAARSAAVFILWGDKARARKSLVAARHLVIESAHPSPLAARGDFLGSRPFSRANAFLVRRGQAPISWLATEALP